MFKLRGYAIFLFLLIILSILFAACAIDGGDGVGGIRVDSDVLSSIIKDIKDREDSYLAEDGDVFWTASGSLWHATYECSHIADSKTIYHGSVEEAILEGKERACSRCFTTELDKAYAKLEGDPIKNGDVFFTRDGEVWHSDINCIHLNVNKTVYNASVEKAVELGKTRACEDCK